MRRTKKKNRTINENNNDENKIETVNRRKRIRKIIISVLLLGLISFVIADSLTNKYIKQGIEVFLEWIEENPIIGMFAFMGLYFIATVLFIPGSILTLGGGFIFSNAFGLGIGVVIATISVFLGASSGAIVAFLLGRYILRDWVENLTHKYPIFEAIDAALKEKGFRIMALLRLSPIIPFNALNYISGVTAISLAAYSWAIIAILPGTILYVFLGATAGSLVDSSQRSDNETITIVTIIIGAIFGILGVFAVSYYAKQELNTILQRQEDERNSLNYDAPTNENEESIIEDSEAVSPVV